MLMNKQILTVAAFAIAMFAFTGQAEARSCTVACKKFQGCVVAFHKGKATPAQKRKLYLGCMKTCRRDRATRAKVLQCYKVSKNSCPRYWTCVRRSYRK